MADTVDISTLTGVLDKRMTRQLKTYLDICARCAICKDACHQYVGTGDVRYLPAYRAELIRRIYKKYVDKSGRITPGLYEGHDPDEDLLDELYQVNARQLLGMLQRLGARDRRVVVVGHEPTMSSLAYLLHDSQDKMARQISLGIPTSTACILEVPVPWEELDRNRAHVREVVRPAH